MSMKALFIEKYGDTDVMQVGEQPKPVPGPGQVLVRVKASSVNPVDWKIRDGDLAIISGKKFPKILGMDFAGEIEAIGSAVRGIAVGDAVYGGTNALMGMPGAHAEYVTVKSSSVRKIPAGAPLEQAAVLPVAALTALNAFRQCGTLEAKQVLIFGGTGGVGHFAIQIAKARRAQVTAVCSGKNLELARTLGADDVIDYQKSDVTKFGKTYDVILDAYGHTPFKSIVRILKPGGTFGSTLSSPLIMLFGGLRNLVSSRKIIAAIMRAKPEDYQELEKLLVSGKVKPLISQTFTLDAVKDAYTAQAKGAVGKILLQIT